VKTHEKSEVGMEQGQNRHILVAVDESENAERAVHYVARFLGGLQGFRVTLLTIVQDPLEDYFATEREKTSWMEEARRKADELVAKHREAMVQGGFPEESVAALVVVRQCNSIGECILDARRELGAQTVVIGRRGLSKREEFIFGSTSNKILHSAHDCCVWVVE
jgi:nucleotide-binding universal stress UspA family protein